MSKGVVWILFENVSFGQFFEYKPKLWKKTRANFAFFGRRGKKVSGLARFRLLGVLSLLSHHLSSAMRLALLTDLHANREALEACLAHADLQQVTHYAFLGDLVGYGSDPAWVVETVAEFAQRGAYVVLGNHDEALISPELRGLNPAARQAIEWSRSQVQFAHLEFLSQLPLRLAFESETGTRIAPGQTSEFPHILLVHANAWEPNGWEYVDCDFRAGRSMCSTTARISFTGHVHTPGLYFMNEQHQVGELIPVPESPRHLGQTWSWLAQPGSVGQPRDGNPAACYALFDTDQNELTYFRIPYDVAKAAQKVLAAGLPASLAQRLLTGGFSFR